jgi:hypothetical protein
LNLIIIRQFHYQQLKFVSIRVFPVNRLAFRPAKESAIRCCDFALTGAGIFIDCRRHA